MQQMIDVQREIQSQQLNTVRIYFIEWHFIDCTADDI